MSNAQHAQRDSNDSFGKLLAAGRNLWLAGLGAIAEVEAEGRELFDRLVERGRPVEARQRQAAESAAGQASKAVRGFGKRLQDTVEHESRGMLKRLNVMTREDVKVLSTRLTALSKKIDEVAARRQAATVTPTTLKTPKAAARPRQRKTAR